MILCTSCKCNNSLVGGAHAEYFHSVVFKEKEILSLDIVISLVDSAHSGSQNWLRGREGGREGGWRGGVRGREGGGGKGGGGEERERKKERKK